MESFLNTGASNAFIPLGGISRITFMMNPASLPHEKLMQATKLIGMRIAPALRDSEKEVKVL
jgi:hypothetical protein